MAEENNTNTPMEERDPIMERRMREREKKGTGAGALRAVMIVLAVIAALLAVALVFVYSQKNKLVGELEVEKADLTEQYETLKASYDSLSTDNASINAQLDTSRAEVAQLLERIKKTDATNRAQMRKYEKELGTLRSIMRNYIVQIDSLNTLNHKLTADAAAARKEADASKKANIELTQQVDTLMTQVAAGSVIKARGLTLRGFTSSGKQVDRSAKVDRLMASLSLIENDLAPRGPMRVYIRVKDPDGVLLTNEVMSSFNYGGESLVASASREVDYEGQEVDLSIYLNGIASFSKGIYTMEAYTDQGLLGKAEMMLR